MQFVMNRLISDNQSAFVKGRLISDNVLIAHEFMHSLKNKRYGEWDLALKLDMNKAYDRVEWSFVGNVMKKLGFCKKWLDWIQECVMTVSYSITVDGQPHGYFKPCRGLRQGDSLSPYLFLFCAEGLSHLLHRGEQRQDIFGLRLNHRCARISHLFFADDSILFSWGSEGDCQNLLSILQVYEQVSGQVVNLDKSSVFFSNNTPIQTRDRLAEILQVPHVGNQNKYLGLPSVVQRSKRVTFNYIRNKVNKKLQHWKRALLFSSGREVLIKAVATAVPLYTLSCFKLPDTLMEDIQCFMLNFWWGQKRDKRRIHWIGWKITCRPRAQGGLNFKNLKAFILAMLAKQGWRLLKQPNSLISKVYKSKYYKYTDFLRAEAGNNPSWGWKSVLEGRKVLEKGLLWKIGRGISVRIREDSWVKEFTTITLNSNVRPYRYQFGFHTSYYQTDNGIRVKSENGSIQKFFKQLYRPIYTMGKILLPG
ncbi:uncharacterized protein LOC107620010 [Arachis ipaensis]|uniref:uncharacterized protein LOC107620010 n=1 Tax=Arachis ipaensis TaxID=130454 RepID=UPI0007AEEDEC|nr:uncharacterized protein LOC107620010 [Arachis ipaensis]XP_025684588.1 uncharacterized protein LOC112785336 [Arachis hypogaea]